jgi:hypothetical protein
MTNGMVKYLSAQRVTAMNFNAVNCRVTPGPRHSNSYLLGINRFNYLRKLLKYQAPKNKSQTNNNNRNSKFKTDQTKQDIQ